MSEFPEGLCIWFTGRPCSGKTTLANALDEELRNRYRTSVLDADKVRPILCPDLGFPPEQRRASMLRIAFVAGELTRNGVIVLVTTVAPHEAHRQAVRTQFAPNSFAEVYVKASLDVCEKRDVKGMYRRARRGELPLFTGVGAPYEEPEGSDIVCSTDEGSVAECIAKILSSIKVRDALQRLQ